MVSLCDRHKQRTQAQAAALAAAAGQIDLVNATAYEQELMRLAQHQRRLHDVQSLERKAQVKRDLLPEYAAYIDGVIASNAGVQDDVLMTVLVWRIDAGDIPGALTIADYALAHGLAMPARYKRTTGCLVAEEVADAALKPGGNVALAELSATERMTREHDMPDEVRARLFKAIGYALMEDGHDAEAVEWLRKAAAAHAKVGVKRDIELLERKLKKQQAEGQAPAKAD